MVLLPSWLRQCLVVYSSAFLAKTLRLCLVLQLPLWLRQCIIVAQALPLPCISATLVTFALCCLSSPLPSLPSWSPSGRDQSRLPRGPGGPGMAATSLLPRLPCYRATAGAAAMLLQCRSAAVCYRCCCRAAAGAGAGAAAAAPAAAAAAVVTAAAAAAVAAAAVLLLCRIAAVCCGAAAAVHHRAAQLLSVCAWCPTAPGIPNHRRGCTTASTEEMINPA